MTTPHVSLCPLIEHVVRTHHANLRERLKQLTARAPAAQNGGALAALVTAVAQQLDREEYVIFPLLRRLDGASVVPACHGGMCASQIRFARLQHEAIARGLDAAATEAATLPVEASSGAVSDLTRLREELRAWAGAVFQDLAPRAVATESGLTVRRAG